MLISYSATGSASPEVSGIFFALLALVFASTGVVVVLASSARRARREKSVAKSHYTQIAQMLDAELAMLRNRLDQAESEKNLLRHEQLEIEMHRQMLQQELQEIRQHHPAFKRLVYNVAVIGVSSSGKSALISKLVDPRFMDLERLAPTTKDEQDRTVAVELNIKKNMRTEHVLRFYEWGGEHLVKAQNDLLSMCRPDFRIDENGLVRHAGIQAIIFVVDLAYPANEPEAANPDKHEFNPERIHRQVNKYFSFDSMKFLLNERVLPYLQLVVLFVNKIDCLQGTHYSGLEHQAKELYQDLILGLRNQAPQLEVIVGSAYTEAGLHHLFATLATRILPSGAWDGSLRPTSQRALNGRVNYVSPPSSRDPSDTSVAIHDEAHNPAA